ncbi:MAG: HypC/HybG/HupF family hydrogenase formation chaperone [Candidatus Dormibacteraeota bacterium]|nr:HypC/HybG/HupF family hydrogenase formation chaperone [Candidatus Dormibacteraeota bacterium]
MVGAVDVERSIAQVELAGVLRSVNIGLLPDDEVPGPGDYVLVHIGYALSKIDEQEALEIQALLDGIGEANVAALEETEETTAEVEVA